MIETGDLLSVPAVRTEMEWHGRGDTPASNQSAFLKPKPYFILTIPEGLALAIRTGTRYQGTQSIRFSMPNGSEHALDMAVKITYIPDVSLRVEETFTVDEWHVKNCYWCKNP